MEYTFSWGNTGEKPSLGSGEVHVWRADLDAWTPDIPDLLRILSVDERERAGRFRFQRDRDRFVVARGLLRAILGRYLDQDSARLRFQYGPAGKPSLDMGPEADSIRFNLSHSRGLALYALARGREVGIDLEAIRPDMGWEPIARSFLSASEVTALLALPRDLRARAFFFCWTRREALAKALGEGIGQPSEQPDPPGWSIWDLDPGPGYAAALAVEGGGWMHRFAITRLSRVMPSSIWPGATPEKLSRMLLVRPPRGWKAAPGT